MNTCIDSPTGRVPHNCTHTFFYNCRGSRSSGLPEPYHKQDKTMISRQIKPKAELSHLANRNKHR